MKRLLKKLTSNSGVIAIEFSFIYIIFVAFVFIIFEVCRFYFVVVAMDYSLSQAARNSAYVENETSDVDYAKTFDDYFFKKQSDFWVMFIDRDAIRVDAKFCGSVKEVLNDRCSSVYDNSKRLALYSVNYRYRPMKIISNMAWSESLFSALDGLLSRKVVYMIESSR